MKNTKKINTDALVQKDSKKLSKLSPDDYSASIFGNVGKTKPVDWEGLKALEQDIMKIPRQGIAALGDLVDIPGLAVSLPLYLAGQRKEKTLGVGDKFKDAFDFITNNRYYHPAKEDTNAEQAIRFTLPFLYGGGAQSVAKAIAPTLKHGDKLVKAAQIFGKPSLPDLVGTGGAIAASESILPNISEETAMGRLAHVLTPLLGGAAATTAHNIVSPGIGVAAKRPFKNVIDPKKVNTANEYNIPLPIADSLTNPNSFLKTINENALSSPGGNLTSVAKKSAALNKRIAELLYQENYEGVKGQEVGGNLINAAEKYLKEVVDKGADFKKKAGLDKDSLAKLKENKDLQNVQSSSDVRNLELDKVTSDYIKNVPGALENLSSPSGLEDMIKWNKDRSKSIEIAYQTDDPKLNVDKLKIEIVPTNDPSKVIPYNFLAVMEQEAKNKVLNKKLASELSDLRRNNGSMDVGELDSFRKKFNAMDFDNYGVSSGLKTSIQDALRTDLRDHIVKNNGTEAASAYDEGLKHWETYHDDITNKNLIKKVKQVKESNTLEYPRQEVFDYVKKSFFENKPNILKVLDKLNPEDVPVLKEQLVHELGLSADTNISTYNQLTKKWKNLDVQSQKFIQDYLNKGSKTPIEMNSLVHLMEGVLSTQAKANKSRTGVDSMIRKWGADLSKASKAVSRGKISSAIRHVGDTLLTIATSTVSPILMHAADSKVVFNFLKSAAESHSGKSFKDAFKDAYKKDVFKITPSQYSNILSLIDKAINVRDQYSEKEEEDK